mgnify:CR=1 FL=1
MGYQNQPWTLDEKELRVKKSNYVKNRESDKAISTARVLQIFEENKNKKFTNRDIAKQLSISESTISGITGKLRDLGSLKQVGEVKPNRTIVYQHIDGPDSFEVMYDKVPTSQEIRNLFRNNSHKVYTSKLVAKETGYSSSIVSSILRVLLFNGTIKMVGTENGTVQYQYRTGNREGITVYTTRNKDYCSLDEFIEENSIEELGDLMEVINALMELKGYKIEDVYKVMKEKADKKGAFNNKIYLEYVDEEKRNLEEEKELNKEFRK